MPNPTTIRDHETYSDSEIDLILIEALGSRASEEVPSNISFEWLLDYSHINIEGLV